MSRTFTRREAIHAVGAISALAAAGTAHAAPKPPPLVPIVTSGGTRLYPTWIWPQWWTPQPIANLTWTLPSDQLTQPPPLYVTGGYASIGAQTVPDGSTSVQDVRNTSNHGVFTRAYVQMVTRPLEGDQTLGGTVSLAVHCLQWHRRIGAVLALQVAVHRPDGSIRAMALPVTRSNMDFSLGTWRTRALVNWPLQPVAAEDGDVIAVNLGIWADNQTRTLAQGVGFWIYADQAVDITHVDSGAPGNTWVEFSSAPIFRP
jgi:hypothetical protein